jgi:class 3 adenylate cyclase
MAALPPFVSAIAARPAEPNVQPSAEELLEIYLGRRTGERVLAGQTKRGEGENIHAVIWLSDLRDSTRLSETIPVEDFFRSLNEFFDCTAGAVLKHGGEILSYIGDAVFAIFTIGGAERPLGEVCFPEEGACAAALAAARDARLGMDALNQRRSASRAVLLYSGGSDCARSIERNGGTQGITFVSRNLSSCFCGREYSRRVSAERL